MATDKTAFDDYLKDKLHRDILFRVLVWASVAGLATYYASRSAESPAFRIFKELRILWLLW